MHEVEIIINLRSKWRYAADTGLTSYSAECKSCGLVVQAESSKTLAQVRADMHAYDPYKELSDKDAEEYAINLMRKYLA